MGLWWDLAAGLVLVLAIQGWGSLWAGAVSTATRLGAISVMFALGAGTLMLLSFSLAWAGWFGEIPARGLVLAGAGLAAARLPAALGSRSGDGGLGLPRLRLWWWLAAALSVVPVLIVALRPPHHWDPLQYHLVVAREYLAAGSLPVLPDLPFPVFPILVDLLFSVALALDSPVACHLLMAACWLATAGVVVEIASCRKLPRTRWMAAALWLGAPVAVYTGTSPYIDVAVALFFTAALYAAERLRQAPAGGRLGWAVVSGAAVGFAAASKFHGLVLAAWLALDLGLWSLRGLRQRLPSLLLVGLTATLIAAPLYIRSARITKNPFYPVTFPGFESVEPWRAEEVVDHTRAVNRSHLTAVQRSSVRMKSFRLAAGAVWRPYWDREAYDWMAPLSPWFMVSIPLLLIVGWRRAEGRRAALLWLFFLLFSALTYVDLRYLMMIAAFVGIEMVAPAERWLARRREASIVALAFLLWLPGPLYALEKLRERDWDLALTEGQRERWLRRWVVGYETVQWLNDLATPEDPVLVVSGEPLAYYVEGRARGDWRSRRDGLNGHEILGLSAEELWRRMAEENLVYFLIAGVPRLERFAESPLFETVVRHPRSLLLRRRAAEEVADPPLLR